ncbi:MAG: hypothetical protein QG646_3576, partial [Euryarchaeota archaeon]|nr:hypothetical protein [Euryarchaeota archaeon]
KFNYISVTIKLRTLGVDIAVQ